jgi:hypothetical protein
MRFNTVGVAAGLLALAAAAPLFAQQPPVPEVPELAPPPRPLTVLVAQQPEVTVTFVGEYGVSTVVGTVESAPSVNVRLTDSAGQARDVPFTQLYSFSTVRAPLEGLPAGSLTATLLSDPGILQRLSGAGYSGDAQSSNILRLNRLPEGNLVLSGQPYGRLTIPLGRVTDYGQLAISGLTGEMPAGNIRLELFPGNAMQVPLRSVEGMYRDLKNGTVVLDLSTGQPGVTQRLTGKLLELPQVTLRIGEAPDQRSVPLDRVVALQRPAVGRRL